MFKNIQFTVPQGKVSFDFRGKHNIAVVGTTSLNLIHVMELLLSRDFTSNLKTKDTVYNFEYSDIKDAVLTLDSGIIAGQGGRVVTQGNIPAIHCIRYTKRGNIRSYLFTDKVCNASVCTDLTSYTSVISDINWYRLITLVNKFIGVEVVSLHDNNLVFDFVSDYKYTIETQKFIYLLLAECFLTPALAKRVLLLGDIDLLDINSQIKLIKYINRINGDSYCISTANISLDDACNNNISVLSI